MPIRTKTVNQAIGKIMIEVGIGRYSVRNIRGQLWVIKDHRRICKFVDGITLTEIDKAVVARLELGTDTRMPSLMLIVRLLKAANAHLELKCIFDKAS